MDRFLIESTHTAHDCKLAVKLIQSAGYPNNFDWGCKAGVHTGWAMIEVENAAQALGVVPALMRDKAKVVKLNKFDSAWLTNGKQNVAILSRRSHSSDPLNIKNIMALNEFQLGIFGQFLDMSKFNRPFSPVKHLFGNAILK